jgi:hypothetical protein
MTCWRGCWAQHRDEGEQIADCQLAIPLLLIALLGANCIDGKRFEGITEPYQTIDVAAAESGIKQEVRVELGQAVKKGKTLGSLVDDVLNASLEIAANRHQGLASRPEHLEARRSTRRR